MKRFLPKQLMLWHIIVPSLIITNLAYITHSLLSAVVTLGFFLTIPGYLLLRYFRHEITEKWVIVSFSIGLSLFIFTAGGLLLNSFHALGIDRPLTTLNIFIALDFVTLALLIFNRKNQNIILRRPRVNLTIEQMIVASVCTILPLLAIGGAIRLNNGASNILTMIVMGIIAVLFVVLVSRPNLRPLYPYAVFTVGISILFGNSLRGWGITGHDIHHEFSVLQHVLQQDYWRPITSQGDPYNACLSITILPAIIAKITHIPDVYVYKVVFQLLFASFLPTLYYMFKRFANPAMAILGVFAFMTFPTFTNDLPFLNRQEIAFIFFILLLYVNFAKMARRPKAALTIIFLVSIILSHYSSSYVTLILLLITPIFYRLFGRKIGKTDEQVLPLLRVPIILAALLLTFVWNAQVTASTGNLTNTVTDTAKNLFGKESEKTGFSYSLFLPPASQEPQKKFKEYSETQNDSVRMVPKEQLPITKLGSAISDNILKVKDLNLLNVIFHAALAKILQLLVVLGMVLMVIRRKKLFNTKPDIYFLSLCCACLVALALFTVLPQLSVDYDVTRLFQQSLIVLWLPSILLAQQLFFFAGKYRLQATAILFAFLYLNLTGFVPQLTGGFPPQLPLNNSGIYYDYFYNHKSDDFGTKWLASNREPDENISVDTTASSPITEYQVGAGFVKSAKDGYLYQYYTNTNRHLYRTIIDGEFMEYTNPSVTADRNLIYSNQHSKIYLK